jgi:hypothetical protein
LGAAVRLDVCAGIVRELRILAGGIGACVLEQCRRDSEALGLALGARHTPESEEAQRLRRMLPRLRHKLGLANESVCKPVAPQRGDLVLARPAEHVPIEIAVRDALGQP